MSCLRIPIAIAALALLLGMQSKIDRTGLLLGKLRPEEPRKYLELGEELLLRQDSLNQSLAEEVLARAVFLGYRSGDVSVASSATLALGQLLEEEQEWLRDLAFIIDPSKSAYWKNRLSQIEQSDTNEVVLAASECLYSIRYHEYPESTNLFRRVEVQEKIIEVAQSVGVEQDEILDLIEQEIGRAEDDPCRGLLYVVDRDSGNRVVCPNHVRAVGLCANDQDLQMFLRVEMALQDVRIHSWDSAALMRQDKPIRLPSVNNLMLRLKVDPSRAYYRGGSWVRDP